MKVSEVRDAISTMDESQLRTLIAEMYKAIPKAVREEKDIDALFSPVGEKEDGKAKVKPAKKKAPAFDFGVLDDEVTEFISDAYDQYYLAPNRKVPKKERPKWRFKVKDYFKKLTSLDPDDENARRAAELLAELYKMVSYACSYYLFNTDDAFASIQITQMDFYAGVVQAYLKTDRSDETFEILVRLLTPDGVGRENLYSSMFPRLLDEMGPGEMERLLKVAQKVQEEYIKRAEVGTYERKEQANIITEFIATIYFYEEKWQEACEEIINHNINEPEINLYIALVWILGDNDPATWVDQYEKAVAAKIQPRESLKETYAEMKKLLE